ncbi:MAG TPA: DinB family protein [Chloroflexia bacterium]|nr:DinB family protein [Chloroflexia bacterium]
MDEQLLDTWSIHSRIGPYVLQSLPDEALGSMAGRKGRSVGEMFAHIHNVRLMWLQASAPDLMAGLSKIEKGDAGSKEVLLQSLEGSSRAILALLEQGTKSGGKIKGFKPHVTAFLAYLVAHEAYHAGEIGVVLGQSGHPLDKKVAYGMWEWGVR